MSSLVRSIIQNSYTRLLVMVFLALIILAGFTIYSSYAAKFKAAKEREAAKLEAIARTLAHEIDGDQLATTLKKYPKKDDILSTLQYPYYYQHQRLLAKLKEVDGLNSEIYTLVLDRNTKRFYFGFSSSETPHYRHEYIKYPDVLLKYYDIGGVLPPYETENGLFMSAVEPIYDSNGKVVSILEVDTDFEQFIVEARKEALREIWIAIILFLIIGIWLFFTVKSFLKKEKQTKQILEASNLAISIQNKKITDSINYAKRIQDSILPRNREFEKYFPESFIIYRPRDIVSGDFYWLSTVENKIVVAAVDCTGHGVPGALMSMIGNTMLNNIVNQNQVTRPGDILFKLREDVVRALSTGDEEESKDGMDVALVTIDKQAMQLEFAGAFNPLYLIRGGEFTEIKATRQPVGTHWKRGNDPFDNHQMDLIPGDLIYIFSDGYPDQFGGPHGKKLGSRMFKEFLLDIHQESLAIQKDKLVDFFNTWQGDHEQLDDVLVLGIRI